ncbi:MAG: hypothetical protein ACRYFB_08400 [Janthinobacterium lividum]
MTDHLDELHLFTEAVNGTRNNYQLTEMNALLELKRTAKLVAEIQNNYYWEKIAGNPLDKKLLRKIYKRIEEHCN